MFLPERSRLVFLLSVLFLLSIPGAIQAQKKERPYSCGPVMKRKNIEKSFGKLVKALGLRPGLVVADVGASNGAIDVMLSTMTEGITYYIQDIDSACLNPEEFKKIMDYYSDMFQRDLRQSNAYHLTLGTFTESRLPKQTFDIIHMNAVFHAMDNRLDMMLDLRQKLKPGGFLFIRDGFSKRPEKRERCEDESCAHFLPTQDEFLATLKEAGFTLVQQWEDFQGYPMFKFQR